MLFPERQLILRTPHGTRFVRLSPILQQAGLGGILLALGAVGWLITAQIHATRLSGATVAELHRLQEAYQHIVQSVAAPAEPIVPVAPAEAVVAVAVVEAPVAVAVAQAPAAVGPSEAERRAMERAAELERKLVASEAERRRLADGMHFFAEERSRIEAERRRLAAASAASDKRPNPAMLAQQEAVAQLIARAKTAIERASRHVSRLGINPDKLVAGGPKAAVGGPFVEYGRVARGQPIHAGLVTLGDRIGRLTDLRQAMTAVPAGAPLGTYEVSSAFGVRRDPFNGRTAMHSGVDLATPAGNDVKTRAPGKVVFAGWGGVYGNVVEIDHGYGLRTRYGHLSRFTVRVGEAVKAHATIGYVGSSGRSTAPHLHYEVTFHGKHLDPKTFLEAKQHVFQN